jgi:hypothetical protein
MIEGHLPFSLQSTINHQPSTIFANGRSGDLPISPNCRTSDVVAAAVTGGRARFLFPSCVVNLHNFALEYPVFAQVDQTRSQGIVAHVLPFMRIALAIPNQVIKEPALP